MIQKGQILIWIIVGSLVILIAGGAYYFNRSSNQPTKIQLTPQTQQVPTQKNFSQYFARIRNVWRKQSLQTILGYLTSYSTDNKSILPPIITNSTHKISKSEIDLCTYIIPKYDAKLNKDTGTENSGLITDCTSDYDTGFTIMKDSNNLVTVSAPFAELGEVISLSKQF